MIDREGLSGVSGQMMFRQVREGRERTKGLSGVGEGATVGMFSRFKDGPVRDIRETDYLVRSPFFLLSLKNHMAPWHQSICRPVPVAFALFSPKQWDIGECRE